MVACLGDQGVFPMSSRGGGSGVRVLLVGQRAAMNFLMKRLREGERTSTLGCVHHFGELHNN